MDLEDLHASLLVGESDLNFPIKSAGSEQGRVQGVGSVGRHDDLHLAQNIKPVHLVEEFHQCPLDFSVSRGSLTEPPASDGVNLVHEDDAGLVVPSVVEHLSDEPGGFT